jgi:biopolymer transport protein ExbD
MAGGGASFYKDEDSAVISEINVTPLVDVVLVLLIIFIATAPLIAARGISVEKPATVTGGQIDGTIHVTIDAERVLHVDGVAFDSRDQAMGAITAELRKNSEVKAIISADKTVPHGEVMEAIDIVTLAGVTKFALATAPKAPPPTPTPVPDPSPP